MCYWSCKEAYGVQTWRNLCCKPIKDSIELDQGIAVDQPPSIGGAVAKLIGMPHAGKALGTALALNATQVKVGVANGTLRVILCICAQAQRLVNLSSLPTPCTKRKSEIHAPMQVPMSFDIAHMPLAIHCCCLCGLLSRAALEGALPHTTVVKLYCLVIAK